jgi:hypothetical protein
MIKAKFDFMDSMLYFHKIQLNKIYGTIALLIGAFFCCAIDSFLTIVFIGALLIQQIYRLFIVTRLASMQKIVTGYVIEESDVTKVN